MKIRNLVANQSKDRPVANPTRYRDGLPIDGVDTPLGACPRTNV